MAEAIISSVVTDLLGRLTSAAIQEFDLLRSFKDDLLALKRYLKSIQDVLLDAEFQKNRRTDQNAFESWLKDLRSELVKMENVLDEVSTEAMIRMLPIKYKVRTFFSSNQLMFHFRIAHQVKALRKNIAELADTRSKLSFTSGVVTVMADKEAESEMPSRETSSVLLSSVIYGRNEEMEMVVKKICNPNICKNDIPVFAIWGMGGLGKTTLAQLVYNNKRVDGYFELKCWMYVSEKFKVKEVIRGIIESIDKSECKLSQLDDVQLELQKRLRGKRFLIVLDDVWIEESEKMKWEQLSRTLSCGAEGSIVVMTTRSKTTSRMMANDPELQHELGCLSEEDSWSLFEKLAFAQGRERGERRKELEPIGKEIVKRCKGLPLAVKTLGGLMWSKSSRGEWERVQSSDIWELQENDRILPALKLSYDNLLPHLKRCFAYCCLFPRDYKMKKSLLIELWMSNGLIPTRGGKANWYVVGEEIINCLLWKSCFQVVVNHDPFDSDELKKFLYRLKLEEGYVMHDLMHDLAQYVMRYDYSVIEPGKELIIPDEVLHLRCSSCPDSIQDYIEKLKPLRSLFIFSNAYEDTSSIWLDLIKHMLYLRVLHFDRIRIWTLPESICKLKHLRYLNLSKSYIVFLPESIVYLQNLQVLVVDYCWLLRELPNDMRYMRNLQHLHNVGCERLSHMPVGMKEITSLRQISNFKVSELKNVGAQIGELGDLNLLGREMMLSGLENVGGSKEAMSANKKSKEEISTLVLEWSWTPGRVRRGLDEEEVLEGLEPNQSLKELIISKYKGSSISPSWMENLKNLVEITFEECSNCEYIPPLGKLPSLRVIHLEGMHSLKSFHDDDNTTSADSILFPNLQELNIEYCDELKSLPNNMRNLKKLLISSCASLRSLPEEIQSFKQLGIYNCKSLYERYNKETGVDWPKISHIPNVYIF